MLRESMSEVLPLLLGVALVLLPIVVILVPLLWVKRLIVHLEVLDDSGNPVAGVPIRGIRNRAGASFSATGEGHLTSGQLHPVSDLLGETDARGRFLRTYFFRNFHTLLIGSHTVLVDHARRSMSLTEAKRVRAGATRGNPNDPLDFSGAAHRKQ